MPLYLYQVVTDADDGEVFEVLQGMSEPPLTKHPETGQEVQRIFGTPNAPRTWTDQHAKSATSDKRLERGGFTKYVKSDNGKYEKVFGKGPGKITKPPKG
jgi:hypothetical protein